MIDHEILFRKFTIRKCSNHRKHVPNKHYVTVDNFEAHKGLLKGMMKCEKAHEKTNPKATLKLLRLEKRYMSFAKKLKRFVGG